MGAPYQILIREEETLRRVALLEGNTLLEYYQENAEADGVVGTVFLGRVERVLPDVKAAFVKIGLKQNGFLPLKEAESYHQTCGNASLMSGQEILQHKDGRQRQRCRTDDQESLRKLDKTHGGEILPGEEEGRHQ